MLSLADLETLNPYEGEDGDAVQLESAGRKKKEFLNLFNF